jgi:hypothetical protein
MAFSRYLLEKRLVNNYTKFMLIEFSSQVTHSLAGLLLTSLALLRVSAH